MAKNTKSKKNRFVFVTLITAFITFVAFITTLTIINNKHKSTQPIAIVTNSGDITINYLEGNIIKMKKAPKGDHTFTFSITLSLLHTQ